MHQVNIIYGIQNGGKNKLKNFYFTVIGVVKSEPKDKTHFAYYICASLATSIAMFSSNKALLYISYPLQVIAKSAKPIPVMLFGLLIARKIYSIQRYCLILHLVIGVVLFMMGKKAEDDSKSIGNLFGIGEMLLILSLSMDGVLGGIQDKLRAIYTPSGRQMMVAMSAWSTLILFSGSIISGEIVDFFPFVIQNPIVLLYLLLLSVSCAIGQLFIFSMVSSFGPLACAIVTTMRKLFSVLYSIIFKGNESTFVQWCGVVLVFSALFADAASAKKSTPKMEKNTCDEVIEAMEIDQNIKVAEIQKLPI